MKLKYIIFAFIVCLCAFFIWNIIHLFTPVYHYGETSYRGKKVVALLAAESQSNVEVIASDANDMQPCPPELTNTISNTNLFTLAEQQLLKSIPLLYTNLTPTSGPRGTVPVHLGWFDRWLGKARFQFTNSDMQDETAVYNGRLSGTQIVRNKAGDGYDIYGLGMDPLGHVPEFQLVQIKHGGHHGVYPGVYNGLYVQIHGEHCIEWMRFSNGMAVDQWLYWAPDNTNLVRWARFKEPYDYMKYNRKGS